MKYSVLLCSCTGCRHELVCLACGRRGASAETAQCPDTQACAGEALARQQRNPLFQMLKECREASRVASLNLQDYRARVRVGGASPDVVGRCSCCGEDTRHGSWIRGHAVGLRLKLIRQTTEGDVEALAELVAREWAIKYPRASEPVDVPEELLTAASKLLETETAAAFLARRNQQRWP